MKLARPAQAHGLPRHCDEEGKNSHKEPGPCAGVHWAGGSWLQTQAPSPQTPNPPYIPHPALTLDSCDRKVCWKDWQPCTMALSWGSLHLLPRLCSTCVHSKMHHHTAHYSYDMSDRVSAHMQRQWNASPVAWRSMVLIVAAGQGHTHCIVHLTPS